jgi:hypothetical protein
LCRPRLPIQDSSQDVSDPGSCPATSSQSPPVGSLTSWLPRLVTPANSESAPVPRSLRTPGASVVQRGRVRAGEPRALSCRRHEPRRCRGCGMRVRLRVPEAGALTPLSTRPLDVEPIVQRPWNVPKPVAMRPPGFDELRAEERVDEQQPVLPSGVAHGARADLSRMVELRAVVHCSRGAPHGATWGD